MYHLFLICDRCKRLIVERKGRVVDLKAEIHAAWDCVGGPSAGMWLVSEWASKDAKMVNGNLLCKECLEDFEIFIQEGE
jgi:hypothetical protein